MHHCLPRRHHRLAIAATALMFVLAFPLGAAELQIGGATVSITPGTFIIQLAGPCSYVPSVRAALGGGYSAIVESNKVGPEGGQVLTDRTVEILKALWRPATSRH
jgi:hypothetical protein